jgi:ribosomal protein S18 acetylase RimI-like enzyme
MKADVRRLGPGDEKAVHAARALFDDAPEEQATRRFLAEPTHHLLVAYDDADTPLGFVTGIELTHPDKGTEMFLYELGVDESARRQGVGRALVQALAALAREQGCYDMWVLADADNEAARATYTRAEGREASRPVLLEWLFEG